MRWRPRRLRPPNLPKREGAQSPPSARAAVAATAPNGGGLAVAPRVADGAALAAAALVAEVSVCAFFSSVRFSSVPKCVHHCLRVVLYLAVHLFLLMRVAGCWFYLGCTVFVLESG